MPFLQVEKAPENVFDLEQEWNKGNNQVRCEVWETIPNWNNRPTLDEANLPPKWVASNPRCLETWFMPPPWPKHAKKGICIINNDDDFSLTPHKNKGKQPSVIKLSIFKKNFCLQHTPKEKAKILAQIKTTTSLLGT